MLSSIPLTTEQTARYRISFSTFVSLALLLVGLGILRSAIATREWNFPAGVILAAALLFLAVLAVGSTYAGIRHALPVPMLRANSSAAAPDSCGRFVIRRKRTSQERCCLLLPESELFRSSRADVRSPSTKERSTWKDRDSSRLGGNRR